MIAVILAGGKGTRLEPFTISLPKPLLPVGDHPILEILLKQLEKAGIVNIKIAVGHLESLIRAYFGDGNKHGISIDYSSEEEPLGTAGPLKLLQSDLEKTFLLINGDTLTDLDFNALIDFHKKQNAIATIGLTRRTVDIDFGVLKKDELDIFQEWQEKPTLEYLVSMGVYVLEPTILDFIPDGNYDIPDLIKSISRERKVSCYLHKGYWFDIGRLEDYQAACHFVDKNNIKNG
jgi:NDP-sugar pyrophosphorylase family protein